MKFNVGNGMLHGDCLTITGRPYAENLAPMFKLKEGQE